MIPDVTVPVERFHRVLVDEIQKQRPTYLGDSFTVAEIYQILVPYRSHRDALGVEMNGDYEDALLRLLAGAGDLVVLESEDARAKILRELQSKNPNTGLFREFAGAGVHLNPEGLPESLRVEETTDVEPEEEHVAEAAADSSEPVEAIAEEATPAETTYFDFETSTVEAEMAESATTESAATEMSEPLAAPEPSRAPLELVNGAAAPDPSDEAAPKISLVSTTESTSAEPGAGFWKPGEHPVSTTTAEPTSKAHATSATATDCLWCEDTLPARADLNYCPFCGMSTTVKPCGSCRAEMESNWKFCVSCGAQAEAS